MLEMMIGLTVALAISAAALTLVLSGRRIYETDDTRLGVNQSLRVAREFLVNDLRQAGERLGDDFPAVEILDGSSGAPDGLIVRRNLHDTVLRVCRTVDANDEEVHVGEKFNPPPAGCIPVPDGDGDGLADNVQAWSQARQWLGGSTPAYIYDPVTGLGEFFVYEGEFDDAANLYLRVPTGQAWINAYPVANQCRVYLLEERRYELLGGTLQVLVNGDVVNPVHLVEGIGDLQLTAFFQDGTSSPSLGFSDVWSDLRGIGVELSGSAETNGVTIDRVWSSEVLPRNVLSR